MATSYTTDIAVKKIGTGLEAGTWGNSTSQNFERVSDKMGRSVSLDLISMPTGSTSCSSGGSPGTGVWITLDASDSLGTSSDSGAEGRSFMVEVKDGTEITASNVQMNIRGATSSTNVNRTYAIWNNLTSAHLTIDCNGGTYQIRNGHTAMITTIATATGSLAGSAAGVQNVMASPQFEKMMLTDNPCSLTFDNPGDIIIPTNHAEAFTIEDVGTGTNLMACDTASNLIVWSGDSAVKHDWSAGNTQDATFVIQDTSAAGLIIEDTAGKGYISIDPTGDEVEIGETGSTTDLRVWGDVYVDDQASTLTVKTDESAALTIADSAASLIVLDTTTALPSVDIVPQLTVPDISLTGSDGYITFNGEDFAGAGIGIRNNGGEVELKSTSGDWTEAWNSEQISGTGTYKEGEVATLALGTAHSVAHGFGAVPRMFTVSLECTTTDQGYQVGDQVSVAGFVQPHNGNEAGITFADATNVTFVTGSAWRGTLCNRSTFAAANIDVDDWKVVIRAWK